MQALHYKLNKLSKSYVCPKSTIYFKKSKRAHAQNISLTYYNIYKKKGPL